MEMNYLVMNRVLSPIQSALFVVEAYPTRPDALALSNIAAQVTVGRGASPLAVSFVDVPSRCVCEVPGASETQATPSAPLHGSTNAPDTTRHVAASAYTRFRSC